MTWSQGTPREHREPGLEDKATYMAGGPCRRQIIYKIGLRFHQEAEPETGTPMIVLRQELKAPG